MPDLRVVENLLSKYYDLQARAYPLPSYDDLNFKVETNTAKYVLKLSQASLADLEFENALMIYLQQDFADIIPQIIAAKDNSLINSVTIKGQDYSMRMISFCTGSSLANIKNPSLELINSLASYLAKIDQKLSSFSHPNQNRILAWDAKYSLENIRLNKKYLNNAEQDLIEHYLKNFLNGLEEVFPKLRQSIIHNDANDYNILVNSKATKITAIIDFGDSVKTYLVNELAIACAYLMISNAQPFELAAKLVASYNQTLALRKIEIDNLYRFIILRLCLSVTMAAKTMQGNQDNDYVSISQKPAWQFLRNNRDINNNIATDYLKEKIND